MKLLGVVLIFLLGEEFTALPSSTKTKARNFCRSTFDEYELQCSSSHDDVVVIRAVKNKYMKIDCIFKKLNLGILPNYTAGKIEFLEIVSCPLPDDGLFPVLQKFSIENLKSLRLEEVPIVKNPFRGLSSLQKIDISFSDSIMEIDIFENFPNLTSVYLQNNNIETIDGMFKNLKHLKVLHLSKNMLRNVSDSFRNVKELERLHLWKNKLTRITKNYFSFLSQLKYLELSLNDIQFIESDSFSNLPELVDISLKNNRLGHISSSLFMNNRKLNIIRIDDNPNVTLDDYAFANLKNLYLVSLEQCRLEIIPEHVFHDSENVQILMMRNNFLQELPESLFSGLKNLKELYLTNNKISSIPDRLFSSLVNLEILELGDNSIFSINENTFKNALNLKKLVLSNNGLKSIMLDTFDSNKNMIYIDLSNNFFDIKYNPFKNCDNLEEVLLNGNLIEQFPADIMYMMHLKKLNLSDNHIDYIMVTDLKKLTPKELVVDLGNNKISEIDFEDAESLAEINFQELDMKDIVPATTVLLHNNPVICDCRVYNLVQYVRDMLKTSLKTMVDLKLGDTSCSSPQLLEHIKVEDLKPQNVTCPYGMKCSVGDCQCFYRPYDNAVVIDCSNKNFTQCPRIEVEGEKVELNLVGNSIRYGPNSTLGYDNVTTLYLSKNRIEQIEWVPPKIKILKLDDNQLTHLNSEVLKMINSTSVLRLSNNPWTCDCSALEFQNFIRAKFGKESMEIICKEDGKLLIEQIQLCESIAILIMEVAFPILLIIVLTAIGFALYCFYKEEVKIWLYEKKLFLWLITEEELDKDKIWDVFISYSHKDEDFVINNLLSVLEAGPNPFKTCVHVRDWVPGETITGHISNSVNNSRRTLVVLSNNFLESVWGKMEFRTAHTKAIHEGRARVIIIKYGELDEDKVDEELKVYLKTNTYVEWGKPWFWRKLRYALPHSHSQNIHRNRRHANMMFKTDHKFNI